MSNDRAPARRGLLLVISSPSGAGKTSLARRLVATHSEITLSVSATTRSPRPGEVDGREYSFIAAERFASMAKSGGFLEWAVVHEHHYGTPRAPVLTALEEGRDVLFDIDWQGALAIKAAHPFDAVGVFVLPPTMADLATRLHTRAQDAEDVITRRLGRARGEIEKWREYDYVLINDDIERAYGELECIYRAERLKRARNPWIAGFIDGLLNSGD